MKRILVNQKIGNQHGFALILITVGILICTSIVLVAGLSLTESISLSPAATGKVERTLATAEAGLDAAIARIEGNLLNNPDWTFPNGNYNPGGSLTGELDGATFTVTYEDAGPHHVTLRSLAIYADCTRTVTKGLTRIAQGANFAMFSGFIGNPDTDYCNIGQPTEHIKGNVYTNTAIKDSWAKQRIFGKVYRNGVVCQSTSLEGVSDLDRPYAAITWNLQQPRNERAAFDALIANTPPMVTNYPNPGDCSMRWWGGTVYRYNQDQCWTHLRLMNFKGNMHVDIQNTRIDGQPINIILKVDPAKAVVADVNDGSFTTISNVFSLSILAGGPVNFVIQGTMGTALSAVIEDHSNGPTYFFYQGTLTMSNSSRISSDTNLRIMAHNMNLNGSSAIRALQDLRIYGFPDVTNTQSGRFSIIQNVSVFPSHLILDGATLSMAGQAHIWGVVYCDHRPPGLLPGEYTITMTANQAHICGTLINNSGGQWLNLGAAGAQPTFLVESARNVWHAPAAYVPTMVGLNPAGTDGYSSWREVY